MCKISVNFHSVNLYFQEYNPVGLFKPGSQNEDMIEHLDISNDSLDVDDVFDDSEFHKKRYCQSREVCFSVYLISNCFIVRNMEPHSFLGFK